MTKNEKQVITALFIAIFVVAATLVFFLIKDRGSSSGSGSQEMDMVKDEVQEKSTENDTTEESTEESTTEDSDNDSTDTAQAATSSSSTRQTVKPEEVMDADDGYIFPNGNAAYLSGSDVKNLTTEQIQYAINEVYARHGLKFTKKENKKRFEKKKWYKGTVDEQDDITLNKYEKKNVDIMAKELKKRGAR